MCTEQEEARRAADARQQALLNQYGSMAATVTAVETAMDDEFARYVMRVRPALLVLTRIASPSHAVSTLGRMVKECGAVHWPVVPLHPS